jgi:predicted transposase YbfD/YdcC
VESRRAHGEQVELERRSSLGSLPAAGGRCSAAVRPQWGGENKWQWGLEGSLAAEASRMRHDQGAQTCSVLRPIALPLRRRESPQKRGSQARRQRAGWDRDYLLHVLTASAKCACPDLLTLCYG